MVFSACYSATVFATVTFEADSREAAYELLDKLDAGTLLNDKVIGELNDCEYYDIELADLDVASPGYDYVTMTAEEIADELEYIETKE